MAKQAANPGDIRALTIRNRSHPTLAALGLATRHFPNYVNQQYSPHRLDVVLISFIFSGNAVHVIDDDRFPSSGPTLGITHIDQHHSVMTDAAGIEIMNIFLDLDRLVLPVLPPPLNDYVHRLIPLQPRFANKLNRILRVELNDGAGIVNVARNLHRELVAQPLGYERAALDYLRLFLIEACRYAAESGVQLSAGEQNTAKPNLERVRQFIDEHYREEITLDRLAAVAGLSPNYLCRAFKQYTGKTPFTYLQERRIQAAMVLLRGTSDKVVGIACDCGFHDLSYFNRTFRRLVGTTPSGYRRCN